MITMLRSSASKIALISMATVFVCAIVAKADIVQDGLVAYYSLDADTIDGKKR